MPDDWGASQGVAPPPTALDPSRGQRFTILDGRIEFEGVRGTGIVVFGTGRTIPGGSDGVLRFAAIGTVIRGFGQLEGLTGDLVLGGHLEPDGGLSLELTLRLADPEGKLVTESAIEPLRAADVSLGGRTFICFHGEPDPENPQSFNRGPGGEIIGSNVHELLRAVELDFGVDARGRIRTRAAIGPVIGRGFSKTLFNPLIAPGTPANPIPYETRGSSYTFRSEDGVTVATLDADTTEGRAFVTSIAGIPSSVPSFRFAGFGPFLRGTGSLSEPRGLLTVTSLGSLGAFVVSNFYTLFLLDPRREFLQGEG